jgi:hypothetical protein
MKRIAILTALILAAVSSFGQAARVDIPLQTSGPNVPISGGPLPQALWVANAAAYLCTHPSTTLVACQAHPITTYTDSTEGTTCPTATPLVQLPGNTCTAATGTTANVGFWYGGGLFDYWIVSSYGAYGPFSGNSGGSGGSSVWGGITGTLSNQTDLQTALNGKQASGNYLTALTGDCTATGPGSVSITCTKSNGTAFGTGAFVAAYVLPSTVVQTNQTNTYGAYLQDFSSAPQVKHPVAAGYASAANGEIGYDSTNLNWHGWDNGSDWLIGMLPKTGVTNSHCVNFAVSGNTVTLNDAGGPCTTGGSMVWPTTAGIPYWTSGTAWGGAYNSSTPIPANYLPAALSSSTSVNSTTIPASSTLATISGSPVSPNVACFSASTAIGPCTSANIQTAIGASVYDAYGAAAARQANLSLAPGTYVNGDMCTYASSGTLLNCNTAVPTGGISSVTAGQLTIAGPSNTITNSIGFSTSGIASTIVERDTFNNINATTFTGALTGHASLDAALTGAAFTGPVEVQPPTAATNGTNQSSPTFGWRANAWSTTNSASEITDIDFQAIVTNTAGSPLLTWTLYPYAQSGLTPTYAVDFSRATAGVMIPYSAPPTPLNGQIWTTSSGLYAQIAGATVGPYGAAYTLPSQYKTWSCEPGLGDGLNAITAGTYLQSTCWNKTGATVTLTGVGCFTDNAGSSTLNAAGNTLGALLTGAVTCTSSLASGTQSSNVLLTNGDYIKFTFVADGTSKQTTFVVTGSY